MIILISIKQTTMIKLLYILLFYNDILIKENEFNDL